MTVDLSAYPDLVMILLGVRVNSVAGVKILLGFGLRIAKAARDFPDGLLSHETFLWSSGIRWRDFAALETWSRSEPHRACAQSARPCATGTVGVEFGNACARSCLFEAALVRRRGSLFTPALPSSIIPLPFAGWQPRLARSAADCDALPSCSVVISRSSDTHRRLQ